MIPERGAVLGIDVGYSKTGRTTGLCALTWDEDALTWQAAVTGTADDVRTAALRQLLEKVDHVMVAAIDGPIRPGLTCVRQYRCAESLLARGMFHRRGKPGASHFGVGWDLHCAATDVAKLAARLLRVRDDAVVEAFPTGFLAVLHDEDGFPLSVDVRRRWTDVLYGRAPVREALVRLVKDVAGSRALRGDWTFAGSSQAELHEKRSALVCALTALCVAAHRFVAVGATADSFIHLPPRSAWSAWAEAALRDNVEAARCDHARGWSPLAYSDGLQWLPPGGHGGAVQPPRVRQMRSGAVQPPHCS